MTEFGGDHVSCLRGVQELDERLEVGRAALVAQEEPREIDSLHEDRVHDAHLDRCEIRVADRAELEDSVEFSEAVPEFPALNNAKAARSLEIA